MLMKRIMVSVLALVLALSSFGSLEAAAATSQKKVKSSVQNLLIREKASTKSKKLGMLDKYETITYKGKSGVWYKVSFEGKTAYVHTKYSKVVTVSASAAKAASGWKTVTNVSATAYTPYDPGSGGYTAIGWDIKSSKKKVVAVDPRVIPLRSTVKVYYKGKLLGTYTAADTGGAIKGKKLDILYYSRAEAFKWGRRTVTVQYKR